MSPVRLTHEQGRAAGLAAMACCAVLAAIALWLCVRLLWAVLPSDDAALAGAGVSVAMAPASTPARSITQWHLFGTATAERVGDGPSTTSLILRGTLADKDPKAGLAVIADAGNPERTWRVGEEISPGVRLAAVYADRVVVARGGVEETLKLPRDTNLVAPTTLQPTPGRASSRDAATGAPAVANARTGTSAKAPPTWAQTVEHLRRNPDELMRRVKLVPVLDGAKLAGVRVSTGTDIGLLNQIGLEQGDVVTSVNGQPLDSIERGQQIMTSLGSATSVRVTVLRAGKPTDITVGLR